jgi:ferredoxin
MPVPVINLEYCIMCEICVELAPEVFQINDMGYVEVLSSADDPSLAILESVHEAIKNCPKDCISIE